MLRDAEKKLERLRSYFRELDGALVAYSGGVDSSVIAKAAYDALGAKALAVTIISPAADPAELSTARKVAKYIGIKHLVVEHDELEDEDFCANTPDRCYYCKKSILAVLGKIADEKGLSKVVEGTNAGDLAGHRPGFRAVNEAGARSPLADLGYTKEDVRKIAEYLRLPNAKKPSTACLASRIPHGTRITKDLLEKVARAEAVVRKCGVSQLRVRIFGKIAVIEVLPEDFSKITRNGKKLAEKLKKIGFHRVALDLEGYSTGSLGG